MGCCGKAIQTAKGIVVGHTNLARGKKYEFTDRRIRICQKCPDNYWIGRRLFCQVRLRRFGSNVWPDPWAYVPGFARKEAEKCPLGRWGIEGNG